jgi:hypothetical protein
MLNFNLAISQLGLQEIPLKGQAFTWSNMQRHPLLEKLDWCFISQAWSCNFPATSAHSMARSASDHVQWVVNVQVNDPKPPIFRFENYWLQLEDFHSIFQGSWTQSLFQPDPAKRLMAKFKQARKVIQGWHKSLLNLAKLIVKVETIIQLMDFIEESRDLIIQEWNLKDVLVHHLHDLLSKQRTYWKQRGQIKWATLGDAGTKFFLVNATTKHRHNLILSLEDDNGIAVTSCWGPSASEGPQKYDLTMFLEYNVWTGIFGPELKPQREEAQKGYGGWRGAEAICRRASAW